MQDYDVFVKAKLCSALVYKNLHDQVNLDFLFFFIFFYCEQSQIAEQQTMLDPIAKANTKGLEQKRKEGED